LNKHADIIQGPDQLLKLNADLAWVIGELSMSIKPNNDTAKSQLPDQQGTKTEKGKKSPIDCPKHHRFMRKLQS
jgi:hypothetical protein